MKLDSFLVDKGSPKPRHAAKSYSLLNVYDRSEYSERRALLHFVVVFGGALIHRLHT